MSLKLLSLTVLSFGMSFLITPTSAQQVINLWPDGHPTLQGKNESELIIRSKNDPTRIQSIRNVHIPSIEVHLPTSVKPTGCGLIVAPGGGHQQLVWGSEGTDIAKWLNDRGIAAFILKYRLEQTPNYKYAVEGEALQDSQRAIRIVRSRAKEFGILPNRVGFFGFSAGGALGALVDIRFDTGKPDSKDDIEKVSCRPDFVCLVYPGWKPMDITARKDSAPAFLTSAGLDDAFHAKQTVEFHSELFKVGVQSELHIYGHGGHGGAISPRNGIPFGTWQVRFEEWMKDLGYLTPSP